MLRLVEWYPLASRSSSVVCASDAEQSNAKIWGRNLLVQAKKWIRNREREKRSVQEESLDLSSF